MGQDSIRMRCPKCQFDHPLQTTECLKCGIIFARYLAATHFHVAGSGEWRTEGLLRRGSAVEHRDPTPYRTEYDENYAHDKDGHKH